MNQTNQARQEAARKLHALFEADWEYTMKSHPEWASHLGDKRWNDRWTDHSLEAIQARHDHTVGTLADLHAIDRSLLDGQDQLNYDLFQDKCKTEIEAHPLRRYLLPIHQRGGIQMLDTSIDSLPFDTTKDYEDWVGRLEAFEVLVDQTIALMQEGIRAGILHPKIVLGRIPRQIETQIVDDPTRSGFYKPFTAFPDAVPGVDRERLAAAAKKAIIDKLVPSFKRLHEFVEKEYYPASLDQVGMWQLPDGDAGYAFLVRMFTTTTLSPEEVHRIGLEEVSRIVAETDRVIASTGFTGSRAEFFQFLRTDPQFYYKTGDELLAACRILAKRIDPLLAKYFRKLPRTPYGVEPIPDAIAPDTTMAYYEPLSADGSRAGTYRINLYKPESRPKYELPALTMHEAVPGHHLQIAYATELDNLPMFRRHGHWTGYVEGWALYSESLGEEMGLYDDAYDKVGQLTYEVWRAIRLVVDTGIHAKHWDRQKAIDYFMENAAKTELDVVNEIDRYIAWPAQAVAYKIGEIKIKELRKKASAKLGPAFQLRDFHDVLLREGPLPLTVLERLVDEWIEEVAAQAN
jgi:uncharacterized protein (DUF885 family)